jgi:hypothetical protein
MSTFTFKKNPENIIFGPTANNLKISLKSIGWKKELKGKR